MQIIRGKAGQIGTKVPPISSAHHWPGTSFPGHLHLTFQRARLRVWAGGGRMGQGTDVFVIGGGPAGLAAAIAASQKGFRVTVADGSRPPIDKPCGEGLMPDTLAALRGLGVAIGAHDGYPFRGIRFIEGKKLVHAEFPDGSGLGIRRTLLHAKMVERAAACGVHFLWNTPITGLREQGVVAGGEFHPAKWVVGADGMRSRVRRWA